MGSNTNRRNAAKDQYRIITKGKRKVELCQNNNAISMFIYCGAFASLC